MCQEDIHLHGNSWRRQGKDCSYESIIWQIKKKFFCFQLAQLFDLCLHMNTWKILYCIYTMHLSVHPSIHSLIHSFITSKYTTHLALGLSQELHQQIMGVILKRLNVCWNEKVSKVHKVNICCDKHTSVHYTSQCQGQYILEFVCQKKCYRIQRRNRIICSRWDISYCHVGLVESNVQK